MSYMLTNVLPCPQAPAGQGRDRVPQSGQLLLYLCAVHIQGAQAPEPSRTTGLARRQPTTEHPDLSSRGTMPAVEFSLFLVFPFVSLTKNQIITLVKLDITNM